MSDNVYVGARYVPVFANPAEWSITTAYEPLTIVTHNGASYTSKTYVPSGIELTNTDYWVVTGNYNAQVEAYRKEVTEMNTTINERLNTALKSIDETLASMNNNIDEKLNSVNDSIVESDAILTALKNNIDFLKDKSILIIGDSMSDEDTQPPNWVARLKELVADINCTVVNEAVDGSSLTSYDTSNLGMADKLSGFLTTKNDYDYIIFHIGTNDCTGQRAIGAWSDSNALTFMGALNVVNNTLVGKDNRSKIFWVIPPHTNFGETTYPRPINLNVYRSCIVKACNRYKWSIIDAYTHAPFLNPYNETSKERWITDGLHPNASYAPYFTEFVINQLRVGGVTTIGDIKTCYNFPIAIDGESGNLSVWYHANGTFDISIAVSLSTPWGGGWLAKDLPSVLTQEYSTYVVCDSKNCAFSFTGGGIWFGVPTGETVSSLLFRVIGLPYYAIDPPYAFSY